MLASRFPPGSKGPDPPGLNRQFLHAERIVFPELSGTLEKVYGRCYAAPLPTELAAVLAQLKIEHQDRTEYEGFQ